MAMTVSVILYKRLGISNTDIALYTSWLYLPWVIKPLWSPFVDMFRTKRFWIVAMQLVIGASFACVALTIPAPGFFRYTLAFFWIMAFSSATHDIAADGFYMLGLKEHQQAAFVGVRTIFYRIAMIAAKGILVVLAGTLETARFQRASRPGRSPSFCWPRSCWRSSSTTSSSCPIRRRTGRFARDLSRSRSAEFFRGFVLFFRRKDILAVLAFFLFYRFAEAQLVKMVAPFLLDPRAKGGLGLIDRGGRDRLRDGRGDRAHARGTPGRLGHLPARAQALALDHGLRDAPAGCDLHLALPGDAGEPLLINIAVAVEQFGYGFGFTAYSLVMIMVSEGEYKTVHYAIATGIMALGMMLPAMFTGWLQEQMGYSLFFLWILLSTIPGFIVTAMIRIDPAFGKGE